MSQIIKIGARNSALSIRQTTDAIERLQKIIPAFEWKISPMSSPGDRDKACDLRSSAPDFFTRDIDEALINCKIDSAVHSAKDLPEKLNSKLDLFWLPWSEDPRDVLVFKKKIDPLDKREKSEKQLRIGISSKRRDEYCRSRFPDAEILPIRGNIEERIAQLDNDGYDILIMAAAGLKRLNLQDRIDEYIPTDEMPPPPGQGYLAMTFRSGDRRFEAVRKLFVKPVVFAGAGAGDPEFATLATVNALKNCEVCLYDALAPAELLKYLPEKAEAVFVGKRSGEHSKKQPEICKLITEYARRGKKVVRLKGGDPGIFGRLAEEVDALEELSLPYRVIPGISSLNVATTATGMLLTRRGIARGFSVMTPREAGSAKFAPINGSEYSSFPLAFFMGTAVIGDIVKNLLKEGRSTDEPATVVCGAGTTNELIISGNLANIAEKYKNANIVKIPGLLLVGKTANPQYIYKNNGALANRKVLITCSDTLQEKAACEIRNFGGIPISMPMISNSVTQASSLASKTSPSLPIPQASSLARETSPSLPITQESSLARETSPSLPIPQASSLARETSPSLPITQESSLARETSPSLPITQASSLARETSPSLPIPQASSLARETSPSLPIPQASSLASKTSPSDVTNLINFDYANPLKISERNRPHWNQDGVTYFVTFRLADSIPRKVINQIREERKKWITKHLSVPQASSLAGETSPSLPVKNENESPHLSSFSIKNLPDSEKKEYYLLFSKRIQNLLDAGTGSCCLKSPEIGQIVADSLKHYNGERYKLEEWVVMPNHVHVIVTPLRENTLAEIVKNWKSFTAHQINKLLKRKGTLWMHESYDHIVRDQKQLEAITKYVRNNPGKIDLKYYFASFKDDKKGDEERLGVGEGEGDGDACVTEIGIVPDWYLFTSPTSVRVFMKEFKNSDCDIRKLPKIMVCGPGTECEFRKFGIIPEITASENFGAEGIIKSVKLYKQLPKNQHTRNDRSATHKFDASVEESNSLSEKIVRWCSDKSGQELSSELRKLGYKVEDVILYHNQAVQYEALPNFDAAIFASASAVDSFIENFGKNALNDKIISVIGAPTKTALKNSSERCEIVTATEATIAGTSAKLAEYYINNMLIAK